MIGSVLATLVGGIISRMRFPHQGEGGRAVSDTVLQTFQQGCEFGLKGYPYERVLRESQSLPWNIRAFFNEGHAMGAAGRAACLFRQNPESAMISPNYQLMRFVGYGFWNGAAAMYPLPKISEEDSYWNTIPAWQRWPRAGRPALQLGEQRLDVLAKLRRADHQAVLHADVGVKPDRIDTGVKPELHEPRLVVQQHLDQPAIVVYQWGVAAIASWSRGCRRCGRESRCNQRW